MGGAPPGRKRFNLLASRGNKGNALAFYGHMDTVPPYGKWANDPFELIKSGDKLKGLGVWDMKAGLAAIIKACEAADKERKIKVLFGVDEEDISRGAWTAVKSGFLNDAEGVVVTEAGNSLGEHPGPRMITLGRRGRGVYVIEVPGVSAHGADMAKGLNAIDQASIIVREISKMRMSEHRLLPRANQFIRSFHSQTDSLSVPDSAVLELDRHLVPPETPQGVLLELQKAIDALYANGTLTDARGRKAVIKLKERETPFLAPYTTDERSVIVKKLSESVENVMHAKPTYNYGLSVADENAFASLGLPVVTIGAAGGNDHSSEEWLSEKSYLQLIEVLKNFISA